MTIVSVRALLRLKPMDRWLVAEAAILVVLVRLSVALLPVTALRRALFTYARILGTPFSFRLKPEATSAESRLHGAVAFSRKMTTQPARVAWALGAVTRRLPGRTSCLVEALVCQAMLQRLGFVAFLRLGVRRLDHARLAAHAWVECDGEVVIGGVDDLRDYAPLAPPSRTVGGLSLPGR